LIDVETYEYFSVHSSGSEGVLVLIQHYRDVPLMRKESFLLAPGFDVDVGLGITEISTTDGAISRSDLSTTFRVFDRKTFVEIKTFLDYFKTFYNSFRTLDKKKIFQHI